jgi:hypothetical protein
MYLNSVPHITANTINSIVAIVWSITTGTCIPERNVLLASIGMLNICAVLVPNKGIEKFREVVALEGRLISSPVTGLIYTNVPAINLKVRKGSVLDDVLMKLVIRYVSKPSSPNKRNLTDCTKHEGIEKVPQDREEDAKGLRLMLFTSQAPKSIAPNESVVLPM